MNPSLNKSFRDAKLWREEAQALRKVLLDCWLGEEVKWGKPCYTHDGKNICIIQRMKDFLTLMFFKGALLNDPKGILEVQGPNSRAGYRIRFTSLADVAKKKAAVKALVREAIKAEKAGLKVEQPKKIDIPAELQARFKKDAKLKAAFAALTPGRRRGYALYFAAPKQSKTRDARIDKYRQKILDGKGFHDR